MWDERRFSHRSSALQAQPEVRRSPASTSRRAAITCGLLVLAGAVASKPALAGKLEKVALKIAAGTAPQALSEFVRQTGFQVLFDFDAIRHINTHEVSGRLDPQEALAQMFEGSGLTFEFINERTISVRLRSPAALPVARPAAP